MAEQQTATHSRRQARKLALGAFVVAWAVGVGLLFLPAWQAVERKAFDALSVIEPPAPSLPIVIIGIDDASQQQFDLRFPWPRTLHAELIRRLVELGASVIAFDVQFSEHTTPEEDADMAAAIAEAGNVVLAAEVVARETAETIEQIGVYPVIEFTEAGARAGRTGMVLDGDAIARKVRMHPEAFWRVVVDTLVTIYPDDVPQPYVPPGVLLRYLGPPETFAYVSYFQVLQGDPSLPEDLFAGAMVLIGLNARTSADALAGADQFATPFTMLDGRLMPGVEIHATQIENALMGQGILPAHWKWNLLAVSLPLLLALPLLFFWHPLRSTLLLLPVIAALAAVAYWLFQQRFVWLATTAPLAALFIAYAGTGGGSYLIERRRAGEIRGAFAKYVSGQIVEEMIEHPERLTLGGQRREITVLFSDLAGFTSLSERLEPDAVGRLINIYLNAMTRIIMDHHGMVDKFIGDAVMAEWGAPLDDPQHAEHGLRAALAMQRRMDELQPQFREFGIEGLHLRIGLNSGPAIVGNMGSDLLFDYTAMGDTVNLCSRLEGTNKLYGTPILVPAATAALLPPEFTLRRVDRVRVKGKELAVDVFTPCTDAELIRRMDTFWDAWVARDWDAAREWLAEIDRHAPGDSVAALYHKRLDAFGAHPPPADWDGSTALDKF